MCQDTHALSPGVVCGAWGHLWPKSASSTHPGTLPRELHLLHVACHEDRSHTGLQAEQVNVASSHDQDLPMPPIRTSPCPQPSDDPSKLDFPSLPPSFQLLLASAWDLPVGNSLHMPSAEQLGSLPTILSVSPRTGVL